MRERSERLMAALFDVDGTLIDSLPAIIPGLQDTYRHFFGIEVDADAIRSTIGTPLREQVTLFHGQSLDANQISTMIEYAVRRFAERKELEVEFEPAVHALRLAKESGLQVALVTSKSQPELELFLSHLSAFAWVDQAVCANDVFHPKPHPESAILACDRLNVDPSRSAYIGDSLFDLRCARAAGCHVVAVSYGSAPRDLLSAEHPDVLLDRPEDLLRWVRDSFPEAALASPIAHG